LRPIIIVEQVLLLNIRILTKIGGQSWVELQLVKSSCKSDRSGSAQCIGELTAARHEITAMNWLLRPLSNSRSEQNLLAPHQLLLLKAALHECWVWRRPTRTRQEGIRCSAKLLL
jgi:hypothetical protein